MPKWKAYAIIPAMKVSELGEFGLLGLLSEIVSKSRHADFASWQNLLIGIGDDAAVWRDDSPIHLATTDSLVEGTHFELNTIGWEELGWKAIAVNLSDIAAMGGTPRYALISLALPGSLETDNIYQLYQGMMQIADHFQVAIVGGNITSASKVIINVSIWGSLEFPSPLSRAAATPGDRVAVTGYLGASAAALRMLTQKLNFDAETSQSLRQAHFKPVPRVNEGQILLQHGVKTAIDISDGLLADLAHICQASKVSATISKDIVPVHPAVKANFKSDCYYLALSGGEDYELLFTAPGHTIDQVKRAISCPVTVIGEITAGMPGKVSVIDATGKSIPWQQTGWEHFKSQV